MATLPYWNNDEVISSDKLNSMVKAIIDGDPLAIKVSNATKNDVNQIVSYLSSLYNSAKTNLNSATSTSAFDTAYTDMKSLVSNKLGSYASDDTVDLYSTGIRASIITFLQAYDTMMSNDRLNNKNTDNTLNGRIDSEAQTRADDDNAIKTKISDMQANGGGRNLLVGTGIVSGDVAEGNGTIVKGAFNGYDAVKTNGAWMEQLINLKSVLGKTNAKAGDWYTISVYVKADKPITNGALNAYRVASYEHLDAINMSDKPITTKWQQYSWSYCIDSGSLTSEDARIEYNLNTDDNWIYWAGWMLEKGTVAHDWSPAPEDTDEKITTLNNVAMQNRGTVNAPDFNTLTQAGYYTVTLPSNGKNIPTPNWGTLEVSGQVADGNGRLSQKYVSDSGSAVYTRQYNNGTKVWTAWNHMATWDDINSVKDLANSKAKTTDINWNNVVANSSNTYNYASGSKITLPNGSSITVKDDRIIHPIYLPMYFTDYTPNTDLNVIATSCGECDNLFIPSATMATFTSRPTNPDTNEALTGDCFYTCHYAYSGTTLRAFQKIYSCDYNYVFIRSYNSSSASWTNWSCLTPYA